MRQASSGLTQIAFYEAGSLTIAPGFTVTVNKPCMLQVRELAGGNVELAVSEPKQTEAQVKVTVSRHLTGTGTTWSYASKTTEILFTMPSGTNNMQAGQSVVATFVSVPDATIASRGVFYNRSTSTVFGDGTGNPINSIDPSKQPLLPGQTASFANVTNFVRGLNGMVIDIANVGGSITAGDFQFATSNGASPLTFANLAATPTITILPGGGTSNSTRVKIEFADNTVKNTWLRVTVLANANTGLVSNDVFYFGNAAGEMNVGNIAGPPVVLRTNASDTANVRQNQSPNQNSVGVTSVHDLNKDGRVNASDTANVRQNQSPTGSITMFTAPAALQLASEFSSIDSAFADTSWLEAFGSNPKNRQARRG